MKVTKQPSMLTHIPLMARIFLSSRGVPSPVPMEAPTMALAEVAHPDEVVVVSTAAEAVDLEALEVIFPVRTAVGVVPHAAEALLRCRVLECPIIHKLSLGHLSMVSLPNHTSAIFMEYGRVSYV